MMANIPETKAALVTRLSELEGRVARIVRDLAEPLSADFEEQATEREDDEPLAGQEALLAAEIAAVKAALARIDDGSYGDCTRCGNPVGDKRLTAFPETPLCIDCARAIEKH